eukprot:TRINITY_DN2187_c0_g1_i1.p1 TRINITY_DN2187_c0_g1~~TRINITY_DN2187_c0_g1_i1.p1  ORF type:complete len:181 (-),score=37.55 TRINITY_DN2187_c0_g1_i1:193-735(-)
MKTIVVLSLLSVVLSGTVVPVESMREFRDFFEKAEGFLDIFTGIKDGIAQTARNDLMAIPECFRGIPCAYGVVVEFFNYLKEQPFDLNDFIDTAMSLFLRGTIGCLQPCLIPYTYIMHFQALFSAKTLAEGIKNFLIQGLLLNMAEVILGIQNIIRAYAQQDFYECGYSLGVILWCVIVR